MPVEIRRLVKLYGPRVSLEDIGLMLSPQHFIPRGAFVLDQTANPIIAAGSVDVPAFQYLVPEYACGVLRRLAVEPVDPGGIPSISFSVKRSGAPAHNFQNVQCPIGTSNDPDDVYVEFDRQQLLQVTVSNSSAFPYDVHVRAVAWFWNIVQESGH